MSSYEISLRKELQRREDPLSRELSGRLEAIKKIAKKLLVYTHVKFPYYTPHGFSHSENVEENLNWLIPDVLKQESLSYDIFFLILGAWFHDLGMINLTSDNIDLIRNEHHIISEDIINEKYKEIQINNQEAVVLGKICKGHRSVDLNTAEYDVMSIMYGIIINIRFLTALICLADELDVTANRVPEIIYHQLNPSSKDAKEFEKHLRVIGIAYASEEQRYKLLLTATAYDPKGAKAMENLRNKLQNTLNSVKSILATKGMIIDIVELNLTTRNFIYRPIKFIVDDNKILSILIGTHLYKYKDVAFRELIQNSIDACKMKKIRNPNEDYKIIIKKNNSVLEFEDNGMGMDFKNAKSFLSILGESIYDSDYFKSLIEEDKFNPIARFGIGILSCFLISNTIIVETKKENQDPCKFSINSTDELWKYEKGSLTNAGTKITLNLKDNFKEISIKDSLSKYIISTEIPIYYQENDNDLTEYKKEWNLAIIVNKFQPKILESHYIDIVTFQEIFKYENDDYKIIWGFTNGYSNEPLILFNHGIFVGNFEVKLGKYGLLICVDIKSDLFDLKISREDVVYNERWFDFLKSLFDKFFNKLNKNYLLTDYVKYVDLVRQLTDKREIIRFKNYQEFSDFLKESVFYNSFLENINYPILKANKIKFSKLADLSEYDEIFIYKSEASNPFRELDLIKKYLDSTKVYIFDLWKFNFKIGPSEKLYYFEYLPQIIKKEIVIGFSDLLTIILSKAKTKSHYLEKFVSENIRFAIFPEDLNPIVIVKQKPKVKITNHSHGSAYWGNILLFKTLVTKEKLDDIFKYLNRERNYYLDYIELISKPIIYLNINDPFIKDLSNINESELKEPHVKNLIVRYFNYLNYLPFLLYNLSSNMFVLEIIDNFEAQLSKCLNFKKSEPLFTRMRLIGKLIIDYYRRAALPLYDVIENNIS